MFTKKTLLSCSALALLALSACGGGNDGAAESATASASTQTTATAACERPSSTSSTLDRAPAVDRWVSWGTAMRPVSDQYGGERTGTNGSPSCFEHSPEGSLFAAATYQGSILSQEEFRQVILDHYHPADQAQEFYDSMLASMEETYASAANTTFKPVAYSMESYTSEKAQVAVVIASDNYPDRYMVIRMPLIWADGDWQINLGEESIADIYANLATLATSLEGYTVWGPDSGSTASASTSE